MDIFNSAQYSNHERIIFINNCQVGLKAIIAIHDRTLGPALGGCRFWNYRDEEEGLYDVLRLSKGMTYKAALANVNLGGGKAIIFADSQNKKTPQIMHAMGTAINELKGEYITGPDIGTGVKDMTIIHEKTPYVIGVDEAYGGYGDPARSTSLGVFMGIKAAVQYKWGASDLKGIRILIQGLGHVGMNLCNHLHGEKATLIVSDIDSIKVQEAQKKYQAISVEPEKVYDVEADIFSPCAFGAVINDNTISKLNFSIIAGGANNQLEYNKHGKHLFENEIIYLPDYVVNGGGLIQVAAEWYKEPYEVYGPKVKKVYDSCLNIIKKSYNENIDTNQAANLIAEKKISEQQKII
tara:strand:- start:2404 stop:3456 length:1053 start_codon:yes stop_codon:yes gene_type:complete